MFQYDIYFYFRKFILRCIVHSKTNNYIPLFAVVHGIVRLKTISEIVHGIFIPQEDVLKKCVVMTTICVMAVTTYTWQEYQKFLGCLFLQRSYQICVYIVNQNFKVVASFAFISVNQNYCSFHIKHCYEKMLRWDIIETFFCIFIMLYFMILNWIPINDLSFIYMFVKTYLKRTLIHRVKFFSLGFFSNQQLNGIRMSMRDQF